MCPIFSRVVKLPFLGTMSYCTLRKFVEQVAKFIFSADSLQGDLGPQFLKFQRICFLIMENGERKINHLFAKITWNRAGTILM